MPQSIPTGLTQAHVLLALADLTADPQTPFGNPTKYQLVFEDRRYAPKAVIGLAHQHLTGEILPPDQFSGGEAPGQANYVLRQLGFTIVRKGETVADDEKDSRRAWSDTEVALIVADYFEMLSKEMYGKDYSKSQHRAALRPLLNSRSDGSVEFKHANISAVLANQGLPYIPGYKPRFNYQASLELAIEAYLTSHPHYLEQLTMAPSAPTKADVSPIFVDPPEQITLPAPGMSWLTRRPRRINFVERDAANRQLGRWGEEFVVELERARLREADREDLARRVDWVAESIGDGLGYDILSFEEDGSEQLIEVKTTGLGKYHPFYVTATEVLCSEDVPERYRLYRVFDFGRGPRVFVLPGSLKESCRLEAVVFRAGIGEDGR